MTEPGVGRILERNSFMVPPVCGATTAVRSGEMRAPLRARVEVDLEDLIIADPQAEQATDRALIATFADAQRRMADLRNAKSRPCSSAVSLPMYTASHSLTIAGLSASSRRTATGRPVACVVPLTKSSVYSVGPTMHRCNCAGSTGQRA